MADPEPDQFVLVTSGSLVEHGGDWWGPGMPSESFFTTVYVAKASPAHSLKALAAALRPIQLYVYRVACSFTSS